MVQKAFWFDSNRCDFVTLEKILPKSTVHSNMGSSNIFQETREPIAIIGTACRFSGSLNNPSKLWEFLRDPKDVLTKIPKERFNVAAYYHPNGQHHGTSNVTESYLLQEDIRLFDTNFFNIKPIEAQAIDPQQRLLLEVVYESLEAAGMSMENMAGSQTGVYVGLMCGDYSDHIHRDIDSLPTYMATGTARSIISNRISYFFDWHGPSMTIDTAVSLVALGNDRDLQAYKRNLHFTVLVESGSGPPSRTASPKRRLQCCRSCRSQPHSGARALHWRGEAKHALTYGSLPYVGCRR